MFISTSGFNVKQNGDISGSNVMFTGGTIAGWSITSASLSGSNIIINAAGSIQTSNYASNVSGWILSAAGNGFLEVENASIRGTLKTAVFEKDTINAVGGQLWMHKFNNYYRQYIYIANVNECRKHFWI